MLLRHAHFLGALGIALCLHTASPPAKAFTAVVNQGTDYVVTPPEGARLTLPGFGLIQFTGLPIGTPTATPPSGGYSGSADTVVNRLDNIYDNEIVTGGQTDLEIVGLSLVAKNQFNPLDSSYYDIYAGLQKYYYSPASSMGVMTIKDSGLPGGKLWSSSFTINGVAVVVPVNTDTLIPSGNDYVKRLIEGCPSSSIYTCHTFTKGPFTASDEPWSPTPLPGQFEGPNLVNPSLTQNFFLTSKVDHVAPDGLHIIQPTPAPLPFLGAPVVMVYLRRLNEFSSRLRSLKSIDPQT